MSKKRKTVDPLDDRVFAHAVHIDTHRIIGKIAIDEDCVHCWFSVRGGQRNRGGWVLTGTVAETVDYVYSMQNVVIEHLEHIKQFK